MAVRTIDALQPDLPTLKLREVTDEDGNNYDSCDVYFRHPEPAELAHYNLCIPVETALIYSAGGTTIIYSRGLYFYCNEHSIQSVHYLPMHSKPRQHNHCQTRTIDNYNPRIWMYQGRPHLVVLQYKYACDMYYEAFRFEIYTITDGLRLAYNLTSKSDCDMYEYYFSRPDVLLYYNPLHI